MNLASQAVLEGLNACFDHRRVLYIAELNRSFEIPPESNCRFFACQNPRAQGGNRRALPKSFVNRFTNIYVEDLTNEDILMILKELPSAAQIGDARLEAMVSITMRLASQQHFLGGPYSFNLRDLLRWVYLFKKLRDLYEELFGEPCVAAPVVLSADQNELHIGKVVDDSAIVEAKGTLCDLLSNCVEQSAIKQIIAAGDITELETVTELALAEVKENVTVVEQCREVLACAARSAMRFEWRDSVFVKAFVEGYWLLIEDVNLCR
ncbi:hypothetical protein ANCDUO_05058 [Ancylostoma duodenale]|uniref:Midasin AAA lid domain-containing protein n=1 Tax=Ancylostoma duodenale TaxID=51022 RepID=A0A0C2GTL5_9BILA|nr:hypothetical protein ANCDUO_05058 [Ancylostoma duodenale]